MDIQDHHSIPITSSASGNEHHSDSDNGEKEETPSPKIEKKIIKESGSSAGGTEFSDAVTEFSDTGISPDVSKPLYSPRVVKKVDTIEENVIKLPRDSHMKHSVPLVNGSHKDKVIDHMESCSDEKHAEKRSMVDIFEVKPVEENVLESQPSELEESPIVSSTETVPESTSDHNVQETLEESSSRNMGSVVSDSKDKGKVGIFESLAGEASGRALTGQDYGVDASVGSSSYNSLEGNWGSFSAKSEISYASVGSSSYKSRFGFESGPSLVGPRPPIFDQTKSENRNEEAIAKVSNWSTSESKSANPKLLMNVVKKAEKSSETGKLTLTRETPIVNEEPLTRETVRVNEEPSVENTGEGKKVKKKSKGIMSWLPFARCFSVIRK